MTVDTSSLNIINGVLIGRNDDLYLSGGSHSVLRFATGDMRVSPESVLNFKTNLESRRDIAHRGGMAYCHLIAPEKYRVVSENFPIPSPTTILSQYLGGGCEGITDPVAELRAAIDGRAYDKTDTHWNAYGKIVIARLIAQTAGRSAAYIAEVEAAITASMIPFPQPICGDLGRKLQPEQSETIQIVKLAHKVQTHENGLPHNAEKPVNDGRLAVVESDSPFAQGRLLIFGDSYLHGTLNVLSYYFKTIIFCRTRWLHEDMVAMARPDIIVTQQAERYLSFVYPDAGAPAFMLMAYMFGRAPTPTLEEALALGRVLSGGRQLDLRPFTSR